MRRWQRERVLENSTRHLHTDLQQPTRRLASTMPTTVSFFGEISTLLRRCSRTLVARHAFDDAKVPPRLRCLPSLCFRRLGRRVVRWATPERTALEQAPLKLNLFQLTLEEFYLLY